MLLHRSACQGSFMFNFPTDLCSRASCSATSTHPDLFTSTFVFLYHVGVLSKMPPSPRVDEMHGHAVPRSFVIICDRVFALGIGKLLSRPLWSLRGPSVRLSNAFRAIEKEFLTAALHSCCETIFSSYSYTNKRRLEDYPTATTHPEKHRLSMPSNQA